MRNWIDLAESVALTEAPMPYHYFFFDDNEEIVWSLKSKADLMYALKSATSKGELRGMISDTDVIAWDSWKEVHGGIVDSLESYDSDFGDEEGHQPVSQEWEALVYFYANGVALAPKRGGDPNYVRNHPLIQRIYGKDVPIIPPRDGTW